MAKARRDRNVDTKQKRCPFLDDPREECYSAQMTSQKAEATLRFCGGDFESCDIFRKYGAEVRPDMQ